MSTTPELVQWLRDEAVFESRSRVSDTYTQAADRLEQLQHESADLHRALREMIAVATELVRLTVPEAITPQVRAAIDQYVQLTREDEP